MSMTDLLFTVVPMSPWVLWGEGRAWFPSLFCESPKLLRRDSQGTPKGPQSTFKDHVWVILVSPKFSLGATGDHQGSFWEHCSILQNSKDRELLDFLLLRFCVKMSQIDPCTLPRPLASCLSNFPIYMCKKEWLSELCFPGDLWNPAIPRARPHVNPDKKRPRESKGFVYEVNSRVRITIPGTLVEAQN